MKGWSPFKQTKKQKELIKKAVKEGALEKGYMSTSLTKESDYPCPKGKVWDPKTKTCIIKKEE